MGRSHNKDRSHKKSLRALHSTRLVSPELSKVSPVSTDEISSLFEVIEFTSPLPITYEIVNKCYLKPVTGEQKCQTLREWLSINLSNFERDQITPRKRARWDDNLPELEQDFSISEWAQGSPASSISGLSSTFSTYPNFSDESELESDDTSIPGDRKWDEQSIQDVDKNPWLKAWQVVTDNTKAGARPLGNFPLYEPSQPNVVESEWGYPACRPQNLLPFRKRKFKDITGPKQQDDEDERQTSRTLAGFQYAPSVSTYRTTNQRREFNLPLRTDSYHHLNPEDRCRRRAERFSNQQVEQTWSVEDLDLKNPTAVNCSLDEIVQRKGIQYLRGPTFFRDADRNSMYDPNYRQRAQGRPRYFHERRADFRQPPPGGYRRFNDFNTPSARLQNFVPLEDRKKRPIVLDGSNISFAHSNSFRRQFFSTAGIRICVNYFLEKGFTDITVVVPESRYHRLTEEDRQVLDEMDRAGLMFYSFCKWRPNKGWKTCYDDRMILEIAYWRKGVVISNDQYRDMHAENPSWRELIENRVIPCKFMPGNPDRIMLPRDPLGRGKPSLDEILRF